MDIDYYVGYARNMKVLCCVAAVWLLLSTCVAVSSVGATPAGDNIIITEVEYDLSTEEAESEWFELYNPTPFAIDITGWTTQEGSGASFTFPSYTLDAGSYAVVTNDAVDFHTRHPGVTVDVEMDPGGSGRLRLNNTGDRLTLRDGPIATGATVDFIAWESASPGWTARATTDLSVCRSSAADTDTPADLDSNCTPTPRDGPYVSRVFAEFSAASVAQPEASSALPALVVSGRTTQPQTITLTDTLGGSASTGTDYTFASPASITIPAGLYANTPLPITGLTVVDDTDVEPDETIVFSLSASGAPLSIDDANRDAAVSANLTYTIANDDTTPNPPDPPTTGSGPATRGQSPTQHATLANTGEPTSTLVVISTLLIAAAIGILRAQAARD
ncbi:hypothetical protein CR983_01970 [Candidatus Saccharibacteria bacterium]|nr:MAG: hypothetical protein CR983_01970 [Candidatus Saccharibacteria bacterium]